MATKYLARTIIEGGRTGYDKRKRKESNRALRQANARYLRTGDWEEAAPERGANRVGRCDKFADRLRPLRSWLASRAGRPWDIVRSEIVRKFNRNSVKGWHLVDDHMLKPRFPDVVLETDVRARYSDFVIDGDGILRSHIPCYAHWRNPKTDAPSVREIEVWLAQRVIGYAGEIAFWFVPARRDEMGAPVSYRQFDRLTQDDVDFLFRIPGHARNKLLARSPVRDSLTAA